MSSLCFIKWLFVYSLQATPNDGLPPIVCIQCREQLDSCHRFRRVAHQTNQTLTDYLQFTSNLNGTPQVSSVLPFYFGEKLRHKLCFLSKVCNQCFSELSFVSFLVKKTKEKFEEKLLPIERFISALCKLRLTYLLCNSNVTSLVVRIE